MGRDCVCVCVDTEQGDFSGILSRFELEKWQIRIYRNEGGEKGELKTVCFQIIYK